MRKNCIHNQRGNAHTNQRGNTRTSLEKMLLSIREEHALIKAEMHTPMREKCTSVKGMHSPISKEGAHCSRLFLFLKGIGHCTMEERRAEDH